MSFVGKAVKKIFSFHKRVIKNIGRAFSNKWVQRVVIAALVVFAVGMSSSGYQGFGTTMQNSGAQTGIGAFFSAVGTTMSTGWSTIVSGMFGTQGSYNYGGSATNVPIEGAPTGGGMVNIGSLVANPSVSQSAGGAVMGTGPGSGYGWSNNVGATGGYMKRIFGSLFGSSTGSDFMRGAIIGGFSYWAQQKQYKEERERKDNATVWGGKAFGGSDTLPDGYIKQPLVGQPIGDKSTAQMVASNDPYAPGIPQANLYNPSQQQEKLPTAGLLGKATRLADLPDIGGLLNPVQEQAGAMA